MRSLLVEFHRFNDLNTGAWRCGDPYLIAAAAHQVREVRMPLGQDDFLDLVFNLRYQTTADARDAALTQVGELATQFLGTDSLSDMSTGTFPLQLDLVVNPAELAALPFEAATDSQGRPLFARGDQPVVLTRRVRHEFAEKGLKWPARPRILFAWAAPEGVGEVPHEKHTDALRAALAPWIDPDDDTQKRNPTLTILPNVYLPVLHETCRKAVEYQVPFTHVHLLAHGYPIGPPHKQRFGMALHDENGQLAEVTPEEMESALEPLVGHTAVVTLATCDAANLSNTTTSQRSVAHNLHVKGFPIVVASQLPLTKTGSNLMVAKFYGALLAGEDVRTALHHTRVALYEQRVETGHDWASLVGYARLPEGYADHLHDVRFESILGALGTIQQRCDRLVSTNQKDPAPFDDCAAHLRRHISDLEHFLAESKENTRRGVLEENLGLLGSAHKRLAELYFACSRLSEAESWRQKMREAMTHAHDWYLKGSEHNLSHHWTAVQYVSLAAALTGRVANPSLWHAAVIAAEVDCRKGAKDKVWGLGSLLELYLLAPLAGQPARMDDAKTTWTAMKQAVAAMEKPDSFPLESTERQLRRYINWWTTANGFFPGRSDLAAEAASLLN